MTITASTGILLAIGSSAIAFAKPQGWRQWGGRLPNTIGCINGTLTWKQISSARMVTPNDQWSNFRTKAEVYLILTRPNQSVIKEKGIAENNGLASSVTGNRISAGRGTQAIILTLDDNVLCESWKFEKPNPDFFSGYNE